jgi:hypothetical protein
MAPSGAQRKVRAGGGEWLLEAFEEVLADGRVRERFESLKARRQ